jgi:hypothetical protein
MAGVWSDRRHASARGPGVVVATADSATASAAQEPAGSADGFRPDLEGLRAVAVVLILLYHASVPRASGGYVGVDVFFVLSGFLITGLLLREVRRTGTISLPSFYARRARRLLPAAALVLLATIAASTVVLPALEMTDVAGDAASAALYVSNMRFAFQATDYLRADLAPSPILHYWSLSVEEQFYVFWPAIVMLVAGMGACRRNGRARRDRRRRLVRAVGVADRATRRGPSSRCRRGPGSWASGGAASARPPGADPQIAGPGSPGSASRWLRTPVSRCPSRHRSRARRRSCRRSGARSSSAVGSGSRRTRPGGGCRWRCHGSSGGSRTRSTCGTGPSSSCRRRPWAARSRSRAGSARRPGSLAAGTQRWVEGRCGTGDGSAPSRAGTSPSRAPRRSSSPSPAWPSVPPRCAASSPGRHCHRDRASRRTRRARRTARYGRQRQGPASADPSVRHRRRVTRQMLARCLA